MVFSPPLAAEAAIAKNELILKIQLSNNVILPGKRRVNIHMESQSCSINK